MREWQWTISKNTSIRILLQSLYRRVPQLALRYPDNLERERLDGLFEGLSDTLQGEDCCDPLFNFNNALARLLELI